MSATREETIRTLRAIDAGAKRFREQHPDSPLYNVAWQLSALAGKVEAALSSAPPKDGDA